MTVEGRSIRRFSVGDQGGNITGGLVDVDLYIMSLLLPFLFTPFSINSNETQASASYLD